jgi:hypothetical protein
MDIRETTLPGKAKRPENLNQSGGPMRYAWLMLLVSLPVAAQAGEGTPMQDAKFIIAVVTVFAVVLTLVWTAWSYARQATSEMIDRMYSLCHSLQRDALREWCVSHLYCIGYAEYEGVKDKVLKMATEPGRYPEYLIKERLFAIQIFTVYEQIYFQWWYCKPKWLLRKRCEFLESMLSYFTDRVLQNPRLRHFLEQDEKGESLHLEVKSKEYADEKIKEYARRATNDCRVPHFAVDSRGPYVVPGDH